MIRFRISSVLLAAALTAASSLSTTFAASSIGSVPGSPQGTAVIANGPNATADGYLDVGPDDFGSWASAGFGGVGDHFNPAGAPVSTEVAFSAVTYIFVPAAGQGQFLTENASLLALGDDASLDLMVTSPIATSDTDTDGVDDTAMSSFTVIGGTTNLSIDLTQTVGLVGAGVAYVEQIYQITNNGSASVTFNMPRNVDADLLFDGGADFANDEVGTTSNAAGMGPFVVQQEVGDATTAITLSSVAADAYYGGKNGVTPPGGPPPFNFGSDTEIWDNAGVPTTWLNSIAGVGDATDGFSGAMPAGSTAPEDSFIGLNVPVTLAPSATTSVRFLHTYGQAAPAQLGPPPIVIVPTLTWAGLGLLLLALVLPAGWRLRPSQAR